MKSESAAASGNRPVRWACAAIAALAVADLVHQVYAVRLHAAPARSLTQSRPQRREVSATSLPLAHLFGQAPVAQDTAASELPVANVTFVLTGVIATGDPGAGYAILGPQGKATQLYRAGGALGSNGQLSEVYKDYVVVLVGGRREVLHLEKFRGGAALLVAASEDAGAEESNEAPANQTDNTPMQLVSLTESLFGRFNYGRYNGPGGKFSGVKLNPVPADRAQFGLKTGDVVTAINGVRITDEDTLNEVLKKADGSLNLTISRDGAVQNINVHTDE